jgi:hypothetical protein
MLSNWPDEEFNVTVNACFMSLAIFTSRLQCRRCFFETVELFPDDAEWTVES